MTRHGKNNTSSAVYSYYERNRDTKKSGYGTQKERLSKDSIKDFDACSLSLQYCQNPVCTPEDVLFDKEVILQYIVKKKLDIIKAVKEYDKQLKNEKKELSEQSEAEQKSKVDQFMKVEKGAVVIHKKNEDQTASTSNIQGPSRMINNFWIPSNTPSAKETKLKKPDATIYCPITGNTLKAKDLIPVNFTLINPDEKNLHSKKDRYKCPVTHDVLSNSIPCAVLKTSGSVVTMECVEKFIKKDMIDPTNGKPMKESDIIPLLRGGTGFAANNALLAEIRKPVMQA